MVNGYFASRNSVRRLFDTSRTSSIARLAVSASREPRPQAGEYYEPANFGDLVERLRTLTIKENIHREYGIQTISGLFAILFGAFLVIVTAEWLLRKYWQLN